MQPRPQGSVWEVLRCCCCGGRVKMRCQPVQNQATGRYAGLGAAGICVSLSCTCVYARDKLKAVAYLALQHSRRVSPLRDSIMRLQTGLHLPYRCALRLADIPLRSLHTDTLACFVALHRDHCVVLIVPFRSSIELIRLAMRLSFRTHVHV